MTYEKAGYYWARGWIAEKMQAIRVAGHIWGKDIDQIIQDEVAIDPEEEAKRQFEAEFGVPYEEYLEMLPKPGKE